MKENLRSLILGTHFKEQVQNQLTFSAINRTLMRLVFYEYRRNNLFKKN